MNPCMIRKTKTSADLTGLGEDARSCKEGPPYRNFRDSERTRCFLIWNSNAIRQHACSIQGTFVHRPSYPRNQLTSQTFWDSTGQLWSEGALDGKAAGIFQSTAGLGGGQETTALNTISTFVHHGLIFVPLGYKNAFGQLTNLEEVHGGSGWGAGTVAAGDGSRLPSPLELEIAEIQGKTFAVKAAKIVS